MCLSHQLKLSINLSVFWRTAHHTEVSRHECFFTTKNMAGHHYYRYRSLDRCQGDFKNDCHMMRASQLKDSPVLHLCCLCFFSNPVALEPSIKPSSR